MWYINITLSCIFENNGNFENKGPLECDISTTKTKYDALVAHENCTFKSH